MGSEMCIRDSFIVDNQTKERVVSGSAMKILGFYFDSRPTADKHLEETGRKFRIMAAKAPFKVH